jgi:hypothetical protein
MLSSAGLIRSRAVRAARAVKGAAVVVMLR